MHIHIWTVTVHALCARDHRFMTSEELRDCARSWREQVANESASHVSSTLAVKLGGKLTEILTERQQTAQQLFREWDVDGDGSVSKSEVSPSGSEPANL